MKREGQGRGKRSHRHLLAVGRSRNSEISEIVREDDERPRVRLGTVEVSVLSQSLTDEYEIKGAEPDE